MKRLLLLVAVLPLAVPALEEPRDADPEAASAEKAVRVVDMVKRYRASSVTVRFKMKMQADGTKPSAEYEYRCPACLSASRHLEESIEKDKPCMVVGYVLAPNQVLVQDLAFRPQWYEGLEVLCGGEGVPAKPILRYPAENAVLLETARNLSGAQPLVFDGEATNKPSLFHVVEDVDGRVQAGIRSVNRAFSYWPVRNACICSSFPNTLVVDASNRVVSVQMRTERLLSEVVPRPPSNWASEPAEAREARVKALEQRLARSVLPIYLHIDEERRNVRSRSTIVFDGDSERLSGDQDVVGFVLGGGEILVPLNLDSGKIAALDKMEASLPDRTKVPLEFSGAFADYGFFLLRFADGKLPRGVEPISFSTATADELSHTMAYRAFPKNQNGEVRVDLAPRRISGFKRVRGGLVVPNCAREEAGELLFSAEGRLISLGGNSRVSGDRWNTRTAVPGAELARMVAARDFDPEFAVRKGKDRIRIAWIGVETQAMTKELAREKKAQGFLAREDGRGSLVGKVYPGTPAAKVGIKEGDVLLWVRRASGQRHERLETRDGILFGDVGRLFGSLSMSTLERLDVAPWPQIESGVNETFTRLGIGTKVVLAWVSDGRKHEAELVLEQAPMHYRTAKRIRNRTLGLVAADLTFEVRAYLKLADDAPGVVITKMQDGSPAAIAGLRPFEVITEVDGQPVASAVKFAEMIKDRRNLAFSVRRLDTTRIVRMQLKESRNVEKQ